MKDLDLLKKYELRGKTLLYDIEDLAKEFFTTLQKIAALEQQLLRVTLNKKGLRIEVFSLVEQITLIDVLKREDEIAFDFLVEQQETGVMIADLNEFIQSYKENGQNGVQENFDQDLIDEYKLLYCDYKEFRYHKLGYYDLPDFD